MEAELTKALKPKSKNDNLAATKEKNVVESITAEAKSSNKT